jgi:asparagine synthase (glutamine-hydrolysing)
MCGIAGFVSFDGHDRAAAGARVKRMADTLIHRGPDAEGFFVDDFAALGHRRLSIIDLTGGQQPMPALRGQLQIVFNGEIYNFLDLKRELESKGHQFATSSDTEVILLSYLEWGAACLERFNGMFAFAIWNAKNRTLFLARDRVGKKPLYFFQADQSIAFASELKALRAGQLCPREIDPIALDCYFSFGYIPAPLSIYRTVRKLPAATYKIVSPTIDSETRYWSLSFANPVEREMGEATEEFAALLDESVKCRLMSEVPLGAFLSGGLDSTLVVASMAGLMSTAIVTNSIGFETQRFNELPAARLVAEYFKTEHHEFIVEPRIADLMHRIVYHFDEPFADSSAVPMWHVCEMAKNNVTVALSGDGGDESFAGYSFRYIPHFFESKVRGLAPTWLRQLVFGGAGAIWPASARLPKPLRLKTILQNLAVGDAEAFYRDLIRMPCDIRDRMYSRDFKASLRGATPAEMVYPNYAGCDAPDALGRSQFTDTNFFMCEDVLVKVDRMSMAHSLEVRSPLLDYRILEFAAKLPRRLKIDFRRGKILLRELASRRLPKTISGLPKRGFSIPAGAWLRMDLKEIVEDVLFGRQTSVLAYLNEVEIRRLWREHQSETRDHSVLFWGLFSFGLWEQILNNENSQRPGCLDVTGIASVPEDRLR